MGLLHDATALSVLAELTGRGLSLDQIDRGLQKMVGRDWKEISVMAWYCRMQEKSLIMHDDQERFLDDLEALVNGHALLDDLHRRDHTWSRA
jgi:hypothetical protein